MLCLSKNSELPKLIVEVFHELAYSWLDNSEVVIIELLSLWRHCSEKCSSCIYKVRSLIEHFLINEEILLLRSYACSNVFNILTEKLKDSLSLLVKSLHRSEKWCLLIKRLS